MEPQRAAEQRRPFQRHAARALVLRRRASNVAPFVLCKFAPFTTNQLLAPMLGARTWSLDLQAAIAGGIVLVNLAKGIVGEGSARLVGALITMRLVAAAQAR